MSLLRDRAPRPLPLTRKPAYPRVLEVGMLLLLSACSKGNEASDTPPPPPAGTIAVPVAEAAVPAEAGFLPEVVTAGEPALPFDAGAPEAGKTDAGKQDGGVKTRTVRQPIPSPPGGIQAPYVEPAPPKPAGSR